MQPGAAEEAIGLDQLRLVGNSLGRLSTSDRAGKEDLRRSIDGVQIPQGVKSIVPTVGRNMRRAAGVALRLEIDSCGIDGNGFHGLSVENSRASAMRVAAMWIAFAEGA